MDCWFLLEPPQRVPTINDLSKNKKKYHIFLSENYFVTALELFSTLHGDVCVMAVRRDKKEK